YMERSTIHFLKQKGWTNVQIAEFTGHHRDTIARVLQEAVEKKPKTRQRSSAADVFRPQIATWLDQNLPVIRMLELAREDHDHPYTGSETAFYDYVRKMRRARHQTPRNVALRFEGVPGEYLQIDWGEVRDFPFTKAGMEQQTRYFFAARLKYSRYMYVSFHTDMREETLLRCLIACFQELDGVRLSRSDRQYENGCAGPHGAARAHLEPGVPEAGRRIQVPSRRVCSCFGKPEGSGREPGQICEGKLSAWTQLL
ncbi:MAG TPA: hypothetical protein VF910_08905, partial [Candidatus Bathyarchaeia archaeon]